MYVDMYVCICAYVHISLHVYMYICVRMSVCKYVFIYTYAPVYNILHIFNEQCKKVQLPGKLMFICGSEYHRHLPELLPSWTTWRLMGLW